MTAEQIAWLYDGPGHSPICWRSLQRSLRPLLPANMQLRGIGAGALAAGHWRAHAALLCFPGGRDLPFVHALSPAAGRHICQFVHTGGRYLGICAGAYFACARLHFAASQAWSLRGWRPLRLFAGTAVGPVCAADRFAYHREQGAHLAVLQTPTGVVHSYSNGGCAFVADRLATSTSSVITMASYAATGLPAVLGCRVLRGRVGLSGVHLELDRQSWRDLATSAQLCAELQRSAVERACLWRQLLDWLLVG